MGTCCASRTDMTGKEKAVSAGKTKGPNPSLDTKGGSVKFNPMDDVRNTVTQVLKDTANHEILVLNVPMDSFAAFVDDLQALLTLIQS